MGTLRTFVSACVLGCVLGSVGCGSGGSASSQVSSPAKGVYVGYVLDEAGSPVKGARVSVNGIEASKPTGADGLWRVADGSLVVVSSGARAGALAAEGPVSVEVAVLAPGMEPRVATLPFSEGDVVDVDLVRDGLEPELVIASPADGKTLVVPAGCSSASVEVEGYASLRAKGGYRLDVALVLDTSGSTADLAFDVDGDGHTDTVLDAEISSARCFLEGLDSRTTRVCAVTFGDSAVMLHDFTSDHASVLNALASVGGPAGGTNFDAAFQAARDALLDLAARDEAESAPDEDPPLAVPDPFRAVVFLTDGIATAHGVPRDVTDSNLTQDRADREAAIESARSLGAETGAQLFAFSFIPKDDPNRTRTTLPHCVAACGGGRHEEVDSVRNLGSKLCGEPLEALLSVEGANLTLRGPPVRAALSPDGYFAMILPVGLAGVAAPDHTVSNSIQVTLKARLGSDEQVLSKVVDVKLMEAATYESLTRNEIETAQTAPTSVADLKWLSSPLGKKLSNGLLRDFLVGDTSEFEDAIELLGVEMFSATDPVASEVMVSVDFVFKEACYESDVGWFLADPSQLPKTAAEALASVTEANILANTWNVGQQDCNGQSIPQGAAGVQFSVPRGSVVAFFVLPNRTLAEYRANPGGGPAPLFTLACLNPGGFDQVLSFRSLAGRTEPGPGGAVVREGPLLVLAWEDMATSSRGDSQDFNDLVIVVSKETATSIEDAVCAP